MPRRDEGIHADEHAYKQAKTFCGRFQLPLLPYLLLCRAWHTRKSALQFVNTPEEALSELRKRLAATRLPDKELVADPSQGVQLATMQALAAR